MAERSLETTRLCLLNGPLSHSSGGGDDDHDDDGSLPALVTDALLLRPPFGFLRAVVALHVTRLGFAEGLFSGNVLTFVGGKTPYQVVLGRQPAMLPEFPMPESNLRR